MGLPLAALRFIAGIPFTYLTDHELYMHRCLQLASLASGRVVPNPMVGAVLVHQGRIIGEGYHEQFGGHHAEVNCLLSVAKDDRPLIPHSVMYVSLEPCAHTGKTPPCADRIIAEGIKSVVIACRDPFPEVDGKGQEKLGVAGVQVLTGVLEQEARDLNKRFFTFHEQHRPYVMLKWAQSADGYLAGAGTERTFISGAVANRLVHRWRSEEAAIMVGCRTVQLDDPSLTTRLWTGSNPVRVVIDPNLELAEAARVFDQEAPTLVINLHKNEQAENVEYCRVSGSENLVGPILKALYDRRLMSVMVEGGAHTLQAFIDAGHWDEARIITNKALTLGNGLAAPVLHGGQSAHRLQYDEDEVQVYNRQ